MASDAAGLGVVNVERKLFPDLRPLDVEEAVLQLVLFISIPGTGARVGTLTSHNEQ